MAYEAGTLDQTIAAAAGDDPALFAELKAAFAESVWRQIDLLGRARCDANWTMAGQRLKSIAAGFHATALIALADEAIAGAPGDPLVLRRLQQFHREFTAR